MGRFDPGELVAGRYRIVSVLGRGGMATVYLADDEKFGARVALKVATGSGAARESFMARFVREARLGNRLGKAPGFVRAFDYGELDPATVYLAMDLVEGARPLDLKAGSREERVARVREAARLVALAHEKGVIHRDVKPENFLVARDGSLWLCDFGVAKDLSDTAIERETQALTATVAGQMLGTPKFMSPEQLEDARDTDARADVYALGAMLFLALTGELPYPGQVAAVCLHQAKVASGKEPPPSPRRMDPSVPAALSELCERAIALDREERLASAEELIAGLDAARGEGAAASRRPPRLVALGALLALSALAALGIGARLLLRAPSHGAPVAPPSPAPPPAPSGGPREVRGPPLPDGLRRGASASLPDGSALDVFVWRLPGDAGELELVSVPAGEFIMGADDADAFEAEKPRHRRAIASPYWIGRHDVTRAQYRAFCRATGRAEPEATWFDERLGAERERHPVVNVSWDDATAFCEWVGLALPTEAEWERAARGADGRKFPWGDAWDPGRRCNFADSSCPMDSFDVGGVKASVWLQRQAFGAWDREHSDGFPETSPVGSFPLGASPCGALDMAGEVFQWCADWLEPGYVRAASGDFSPATSGELRALRGGSWCYPARACRSSYRDGGPPSLRTPRIGFRVVLR